MGICYGKNIPSVQEENPSPNPNPNTDSAVDPPNPNPSSNPVPLQNSNINAAQNGTYVSYPSPNHYSKTEKKQKPPPSPYRFSPFRSPFRSSVPASPATGTPAHKLKRPFPPPSPAKHIQALRRRFRTPKPKGDPILEDEESKPLNKSFGYPKSFSAKYEIGQEVGRGHFGHTCIAKVKKGDHKGESVAVKVISKAKMTTAISIEDVKREVKILKALTGYKHLCKFYDVCEDVANVYIVMELCEGGELLDRILARGGKYSEEDAKAVVVQILNVVAFCHLQGVVHRDLKPENFLFMTKEEDSLLKAIDFGLSDFVRPDEKLNDIVGSAYYVAPEVLHRSYSMEADVWSVGVITYILLCGSRPFWARTESGIFRSVLKTAPSFEEQPWPSVSPEAKDFVRRLLNKDRHKRMTAAQALAHPWLRGKENVPLDIAIYKMVKSYLRSSSLRRAALKTIARQLTEDELYYLRTQFAHLEPNSNGRLTLDNFRNALVKHSTTTMKDSRMMDMVAAMEVSHFKKMDFNEFCAAAINVPQLESLPNWDRQSQAAYENFDKEANRVVVIEDLARELGIPPSVPAHVILHDWIRHTDGKLSFYGFTCLVRGMPPRSGPKGVHVK